MARPRDAIDSLVADFGEVIIRSIAGEHMADVTRIAAAVNRMGKMVDGEPATEETVLRSIVHEWMLAHPDWADALESTVAALSGGG